MPVFTVNDQHYALRPGQNRLGAGAGADVSVSDDDTLGVQAIVDVREAAHPVIRRAKPTAAVRVNGVALLDPTPLIHGDKVEIGGRSCCTPTTRRPAPRKSCRREASTWSATPAQSAAAATGGRLVSLVDGKEYEVKEGGLTIGRDASSDIVLASRDVSRKHAPFFKLADGSYEIRDFSANGVYVNEKARSKAGRARTRRLDPDREGGVSLSGRSSAGRSTRPATPPRAAAAPAPAVPPAPPRQALASLEVRNIGPANGKRHDIRAPFVSVGRGPRNDIVLDDTSVSRKHAQLQRRNDGWYVIDLDSANGSYVSGKRFAGEKKLRGFR
jgi:pSer/pThr/pTyr-binding forkhead associated (FHA) protein